MSLDHATWQGRRKRPLRRWMHDLRTALPLVGIAFCFGLSATAIFATEWIPSEPPPLPAVSAPGSACDPQLAETTPAAPLARPSSFLEDFLEERANDGQGASTEGFRSARPRK